MPFLVRLYTIVSTRFEIKFNRFVTYRQNIEWNYIFHV